MDVEQPALELTGSTRRNARPKRSAANSAPGDASRNVTELNER